MDSKNQNLELINAAIQKLIQERKNREVSGESFIEEDDDDQLFLSRLLYQLESLKRDGKLEQNESSNKVGEVNCRVDESKSEKGDGNIEVVDTDEIVKELKKVKKQNSITHWLLSAMIVLTLVWQISEVSLILKLKDGVSHPFRSLGGMLIGMFKSSTTNGHDSENQNESHSLPPIKVPDFPHMEFPDLNGDNGGKH
ncbi:uncharacterized protein LOC107428308 [Ziziphus jujuba]|uniref:Uncharacterized protein LOC107428308 n=2 Tax=Ziziphus jujuba TaxID=326968 RepID=A0A6P4AHQ1_ZIZJJ|nr:uncharacterized protein LOC107428308 [Ziziphus jujuba]KAH7515472.1 hypothetical protein FEM48_Zijuj10G0030000 [Ziziphus jujuba var. spinosa]